MKKNRIAKCLQKINKKKEEKEDTETQGEHHIARRQRLKWYSCKSRNTKVYCRQTTESWGKTNSFSPTSFRGIVAPPTS